MAVNSSPSPLPSPNSDRYPMGNQQQKKSCATASTATGKRSTASGPKFLRPQSRWTLSSIRAKDRAAREAEEGAAGAGISFVPIDGGAIDPQLEKELRRRKAQEDLIDDFVKLLEQMLRPRQAILAALSFVIGAWSLFVAVFTSSNVEPQLEPRAQELATVLLVFGAVEMLLAVSFFLTCMQTSVAVARGVPRPFHLLLGVGAALIYVAVALLSIGVGILGFYKTVAMARGVNTSASPTPIWSLAGQEIDGQEEKPDVTIVVPALLFYTSLGVFSLHVLLLVLKCGCCKCG